MPSEASAKEGESVPLRCILMVGDTVHDAAVARAVGIDCVLLPSGHSPRHKLLKTGARVIDDVRDVFRLLV